MVTKEYMARSARRWFRRKGTEMARAMLRALKIPYAEGLPHTGATEREGRYSEMMECFENRESPMDMALA